MIINNINNHHHYHQLPHAHKKHMYAPELIALLTEKFKACINFVPPTQLSRSLRTFLLLNLVELQSMPPGFKDYIFDMMEIFEALDRVEDTPQQ